MPQLLRAAPARAWLKLIRGLARRRPVRRPVKAGRARVAARDRLGARRARESLQARAEASIRRGEPMRIERLAPALLRDGELALRLLGLADRVQIIQEFQAFQTSTQE
jgi:hypothetical protein